MPSLPLSDSEVEAAVATVREWRLEGGAIRRSLVFPDFRDAIAFVVRIAFEAESADHHPDIDIRYRRVELSLSTHDAGGLTEKDFALARRIDEEWNRGWGQGDLPW